MRCAKMGQSLFCNDIFRPTTHYIYQLKRRKYTAKNEKQGNPGAQVGIHDAPRNESREVAQAYRG
jgi:hypothetical protein